MQIIKAKDYNELSRRAAHVIAAQVILKPNCVLGLATGSSPIGTYKELIEWYNQGDLDFSGVSTVNLDEYKGLNRDNDQSYYYFMYNNLFKHVNIDLAAPIFLMEPSRTAIKSALATIRSSKRSAA